MGYRDMSWTAVDREHELAGERQDAFDKAVEDEMPRQRAAIRSNITTGHAQTIDSITDELLERMVVPGVTQTLVRASHVGGALAAGQLLLDLINKRIEDMAELAAIKEVERAERPGGLDISAMRATAPYLRMPA